MPRLAKLLVLAVCSLTTLGSGSVSAIDFEGEIGVEGRGFPRAPLYDSQREQAFSLRLVLDSYQDFADGDHRIALEGFFRWDGVDDRRTHADLRELYWRGTFGATDLYLGLRRVFWGVTESVHLVDIINQTDLIENLDGEDKLGQPMGSVTYSADWGTTSVFYLPYFRERTFPGEHGRLRSDPPVDTQDPIYESKAEEWHADFAVRWSHILGDFDVALSHFEGTSRAPALAPVIIADQFVALRPSYNQLSQSGLELQHFRGDWLWKLEAVSREQLAVRSTAFVAGFEYTLFGLFGTAADLGIVSEYQYDDQPIPTVSDNDLALGMRYTFNDIADTDLLAVVAVDTENGSMFGSIEGNRRIGTVWEVSTEVRLFLLTDESDPLRILRRDSYMQLELVRFF